MKKNYIKSILALILMLALTLSMMTFLNSCSMFRRNDGASETTNGGSGNTDGADKETNKGHQKLIYRLTSEKTKYVRIQIKNYGMIVIELYEDAAPQTVAYFQDLVASDFYNDSKFHYIVRDSYIEGGIPKDEERLDTLPTLAEETSSLELSRGVVSLVRGEGAKFFICLGDETNYEGETIAFGKVVDGLDVLDRLNAAPLISGQPVDKLEMMIVRFVYPDLVGAS